MLQSMEPSWSVFLIPSENNTLFKNVEIDFFFSCSPCNQDATRETLWAEEQALALTDCWHLGVATAMTESKSTL